MKGRGTPIAPSVATAFPALGSRLQVTGTHKKYPFLHPHPNAGMGWVGRGGGKVALNAQKLVDFFEKFISSVSLTTFP